MTEENFENINLYKNFKKLLKHFYNSIKNNDYNNFNIYLSNLQNINKIISIQYGGNLNLNLNNEMLKNKIIQKINMLRQQSNLNIMTGGEPIAENIYRLKAKIVKAIQSLKTGGPGVDLTKIKSDLTLMQQYINRLSGLKKELELAQLTAAKKFKMTLSPSELEKIQNEINGIQVVELETLQSQLDLFKQNIHKIVDPEQSLEAYNTMETACKNHYESIKPNVMIPENIPIQQNVASSEPGTLRLGPGSVAEEESVI
jgi:organic radical activating enzyme